MRTTRWLISGAALLAIGGVLLWPKSRTDPGSAGRCEANLKQLLSAMTAYRSDDAVDWPSPLGKGESVTDAKAARHMTNRAFALLAAHLQLPNQIFVCRESRNKGPNSKPLTTGGDTWSGDASYAYDWAAPNEVASHRIVLSERSALRHQRRGVLVAAADGSVRFLRPIATSRVAACRRTEDADGQPITAVVPNPDAGDDTIFDDLGDDEGGRYDGLTPLRGSPTRTWVT